jgi:hypothetical protein
MRHASWLQYCAAMDPLSLCRFDRNCSLAFFQAAGQGPTKRCWWLAQEKGDDNEMPNLCSEFLSAGTQHPPRSRSSSSRDCVGNLYALHGGRQHGVGASGETSHERFRHDATNRCRLPRLQAPGTASPAKHERATSLRRPCRASMTYE